ncbi:MAG: efflux RND transporter periplasmic adaptor subunit [Lewinellaceae bacterium]|nr:efflux RND transporter periplasmic adaptor subunit [Lewinellaceae bacterium]
MNNWKILLVIIITALISLGAGYLIFGGNEARHGGLETHQAGTAEPNEIWTCSMHPQIRQNEPGKCPICGMDLIPLSEASSSDNPLVMEMTPEAVKLASIQTVAVGTANGSTTKDIFLAGKVQTDERLVASQVAHVPGRIEQLFVTFTGEAVRKGQKLATIYSPELVSAQRELIEALKWKETQPQLLEATRNKLRNWKISETTIAEIENSREVKTNITVYADQSGVVLKRRVSVGDYLREGGVLFDIASLGQVWLLFDAYEEDLAEVRVGDVVSYTVPAIPGRTFSARISFIGPVIDPRSRIASLRAEVANPGGVLKPEMFIRGAIKSRVGTDKSSLSVPKTAVLWTGPRSVVYVEVPGATVPSYEFREVTLDDVAGSEYLIKEGLEAGERVVVNGAFVIDAAAQLNNMASMMNRNVQQAGMPATGHPHEAAVPASPLLISPEARAAVKKLFDIYFSLKDALVKDERSTATRKAADLTNAFGQTPMSLFTGEAHEHWMHYSSAAVDALEKLGAAKDVEEARMHFKPLSGQMVALAKAFGPFEETFYVQHCPMADDFEGADWLSLDKEIRNPYFGDKMLKCGSVTETIQR